VQTTAERLDDTAPAAPIGTVLKDQGVITDLALYRALARQRQVPRRLGDILRLNGALDSGALTRGLAAQAGILAIDLDQLPADPQASAGRDPRRMLRLGFLPWRRMNGKLVCALADPADIAHLRATMPDAARHLAFVLADRAQIEAEIARLFATDLARAARSRCPRALSCRAWAGGRARLRLGLVAAALTATVVQAPMALLLAVLVWITLVNALTTLVRGFALVDSFRRSDTPPAGENIIPLHAPDARPVISLLIPLYRESGTLQHLIDALDRSTYPKELLDVIFICEPDDPVTPLTLARIVPPPWCRVLTAPDDTLRTKPRALNYALDFARGDIVGIYDAEDRPEPGQLAAIAAQFAAAPPQVGALQGHLDFYNSRRNWLSRCFSIEYAIWFRVLLRGMQRLGMPLPLGGTTVFFRRGALEAVGAWDAHNVTEDADLGMRLARRGYRTEVAATTTWEEANFRTLPWIRQRARWLKGYAMTWTTHMRRPAALWRDLGPAGFLGFQVLLLGGLTAYLATPLFWCLWLGYWGFDLALFDRGTPALWGGFFASMLIGQTVMLSVAARAVWARGRRHLLATIPILALYWPLGAIAAYRAVLEIFTRPFYWDKTEHGL